MADISIVLANFKRGPSGLRNAIDQPDVVNDQRAAIDRGGGDRADLSPVRSCSVFRLAGALAKALGFVSGARPRGAASSPKTHTIGAVLIGAVLPGLAVLRPKPAPDVLFAFEADRNLDARRRRATRTQAEALGHARR